MYFSAGLFWSAQISVKNSCGITEGPGCNTRNSGYVVEGGGSAFGSRHLWIGLGLWKPAVLCLWKEC